MLEKFSFLDNDINALNATQKVWMEQTTVLHCTVFLSNILCNTSATRPIQSKKRQHFSKRSNTSGVRLIL